MYKCILESAAVREIRQIFYQIPGKKYAQTKQKYTGQISGKK